MLNMKAYLAIKYKEDHSNRDLIEAISSSLKKVNIESYVIARDYEKWGELKNIQPDALMAHTFKAIDESDFVIVEFSEKGVGLGIEAGYAFAIRKPIVVIAKEGTEISTTLQGVAKILLFYKDISNLEEKFTKLKIESKGVVFILMRSDNTFLMQLRDNNSKRFKNMWCFPGGACDDREEYVDTAIREIEEEYELKVQKSDCTFLMSRIMGQMQVFVCKVGIEQNPVLKEGADMKWMSFDEIKKLTIGYNQSDIVAKLEEFLFKNK
jgi:2'-deoxynucleoside 5'-phosphate N-hydrolase